MNDRVHLRNFVCWRVISEDGRAALDIQEERTIDQDELTRLVVAQYPPCEACGCIPIEVGKTKFCSTCATRTMREKVRRGPDRSAGAAGPVSHRSTGNNSLAPDVSH